MAGSTGQYTLVLTPITQTFTAVTGVNRIDGEVMMPNNGERLPAIGASLQRVTYAGPAGTIEKGRQTWIVVHGRVDSAASFIRHDDGTLGLAPALDLYKPNDQVLVLDWHEAAADNNPSFAGLQGAQWIPYVADWTAGVLKRIGLSGANVFLVGHSWGSFVSYEIGARVTGGVRGLVALDPARAAYGYDYAAVNFDRVSAWSWAFYSNGSWGSAELSGTANEALALEYNQLGVGATVAHRAPVNLFESLVRRNFRSSPPTRASLFNLDRLERAKSGPWAANSYSYGSAFELPTQVFEGFFELGNTDGDGEWGEAWDEVLSFRYINPTTHREVTA